MAPSVTRTQIPDEVNAIYSKETLTAVQPKLLYAKLGMTQKIDGNAGTNTLKVRRYENIAPTTTPLVEGVMPTASTMSVTDLTVSALLYGTYITYSDKVKYEAVDDIILTASKKLGQSAAITLDTLTRDVLAAGTQVQYSGSRASRITVAAGDKIALTDITAAITTLKNGNAMKITEMVDPNQGYATTPVNAAYIAVVHPNITKTLKTLSGWKPVEAYGANIKPMDGEIGAIDEIRFIESTNAKVFTGGGAAGIDVYGTLVFGQEAFLTTEVSSESMQTIVTELGSGGSKDPLKQEGSVGWKASYATLITNNAFMVRIESAA